MDKQRQGRKVPAEIEHLEHVMNGRGLDALGHTGANDRTNSSRR